MPNLAGADPPGQRAAITDAGWYLHLRRLSPAPPVTVDASCWVYGAGRTTGKKGGRSVRLPTTEPGRCQRIDRSRFLAQRRSERRCHNSSKSESPRKVSRASCPARYTHSRLVHPRSGWQVEAARSTTRLAAGLPAPVRCLLSWLSHTWHDPPSHRSTE
jgi:hypothetical protein